MSPSGGNVTACAHLGEGGGMAQPHKTCLSQFQDAHLFSLLVCFLFLDKSVYPEMNVNHRPTNSSLPQLGKRRRIHPAEIHQLPAAGRLSSSSSGAQARLTPLQLPNRWRVGLDPAEWDCTRAVASPCGSVYVGGSPEPDEWTGGVWEKKYPAKDQLPGCEAVHLFWMNLPPQHPLRQVQVSPLFILRDPDRSLTVAYPKLPTNPFSLHPDAHTFMFGRKVFPCDRDMWDLGEYLLWAVGKLHDHNIFHGDIKPENIGWIPGEPHSWRLLDLEGAFFGEGYPVELRSSNKARGMGTFMYFMYYLDFFTSDWTDVDFRRKLDWYSVAVVMLVCCTCTFQNLYYHRGGPANDLHQFFKELSDQSRLPDRSSSSFPDCARRADFLPPDVLDELGPALATALHHPSRSACENFLSCWRLAKLHRALLPDPRGFQGQATGPNPPVLVHKQRRKMRQRLV